MPWIALEQPALGPKPQHLQLSPSLPHHPNAALPLAASFIQFNQCHTTHPEPLLLETPPLLLLGLQAC